MCRGAVGWLNRLGLVKRVEVVGVTADRHFDGVYPDGLYERLKVELILWDPATKNALGGAEALIALARLHRKFGLLTGLFHFPGVLWVGQRLYKIISMNRRLLSPLPYTPIPCACDPPFHLGYRLSLWTVALMFAGVANTLYGLSLAQVFTERPAWDMLCQWWAAGSAAWGSVALAFGLLFRRQRGLVLLQQLGMVAAIGSIWLVFFALFNLLSGSLMHAGRLMAGINGVELLVMVQVMFSDLRGRVRTLAFPTWVPWLWLTVFLGVSVSCLWQAQLFTWEDWMFFWQHQSVDVG